MIRCKLKVINELGLHARAATKLSALAGRFEADIRTGIDAPSVDAKSIMSLMLLAASQGTELSFEFNGTDETEAYEAISQLFADFFGEGR